MSTMTQQFLGDAACRLTRTSTAPRRHAAWLAGGFAVSFAIPFLFADRLGLDRDLYYGLYIAGVLALFLGWAHDTGGSVREMCARRWPWAVGLGLACAGLSALIAIAAEDATSRPGGAELAAAIAWRGVLYGAADGLLLSAFPILVVFAALGRRHRRVTVTALALAASLAMTATYHLGYSDFRSSKLRKPVAGDLVWSVPTLATLNPIGAPIAHAGLHVSAVLHSYDTDLFLPPHQQGS